MPHLTRFTLHFFRLHLFSLYPFRLHTLPLLSRVRRACSLTVLLSPLTDGAPGEGTVAVGLQAVGGGVCGSVSGLQISQSPLPSGSQCSSAADSRGPWRKSRWAWRLPHRLTARHATGLHACGSGGQRGPPRSHGQVVLVLRQSSSLRRRCGRPSHPTTLFSDSDMPISRHASR